jgi:hypothetical protein
MEDFIRLIMPPLPLKEPEADCPRHDELLGGQDVLFHPDQRRHVEPEAPRHRLPALVRHHGHIEVRGRVHVRLIWRGEQQTKSAQG